MPNFFLIDHSLRNPEGRHFDYVKSVAQAANELGFQTTIGVNRSLARVSPGIDELATVHRVFRKTIYQSDSYLSGLQHLRRSNVAAETLNRPKAGLMHHGLHQVKRFRHWRRRVTFIRAFAADCERLFRPRLQENGDHAFLTTVSELELMGLADYLSRQPNTTATQWHLQFDSSLFEGRTPDYETQQDVKKAVRACFLTALAKLSYHSINFYTTSETLLDQYNRLGVGRFEVLSYPISRDFAPEHQLAAMSDAAKSVAGLMQNSQSSHVGIRRSLSSGIGDDFSLDTGVEAAASFKTSEFDFRAVAALESAKSCKPIRIAIPSELHREEGLAEYLQPLVNELWSTQLSPGNVRIAVQRPVRKWYAKKQKLEIELPVDTDFVGRPFPPMEYFPYPLDQSAYVDFIKSSDCGLLFFDSRVCFSHRVRILGELLAAGKPVIVPAGSWLSEQISEPIFQHVENVLASSTVTRTLGPNELNWSRQNVPLPGGVLSFDKGNHPFEFLIESFPNENGLVLQFNWHWPKTAGVYCRIDVTQKCNRKVIETASQVVGHRITGGQVNSIFPIAPETTSVEFTLTNPFHHSTASISNVRIHGVRTSLGGGESTFPIGAVGVVACDRGNLSNCVDEMVKHFDHYRLTATDFSKRWFAQHDPHQTVNHLVTSGQSGRESVRRIA